MHLRSKTVVLFTVVTAVVATAGCAIQRIGKSRELSQNALPFSSAPPHATSKLLIVGDSTAVGVGATSPQMSLAGQMATHSPMLAIENRGVNGAKYKDIVNQLTAVEGQHYDAVLLLGGGNDVIQFTSENNLRHDINEATVRAKALAPVTVIMPSGNLGNAPFFYVPISWILSARSRTLHTIVREAAAAHGVGYVNLYKDKHHDPFALEPDRLNAADGLHPSDAGYSVWLNELLTQSQMSSITNKRRE